MEENFYFVKSKTGDYLLNNFPQNLDYLLTEKTDKRNKGSRGKGSGRN